MEWYRGVINRGIRKGRVSPKKLIEICPSLLNPTYFEMQGNSLEKICRID